MDGERKFTVFMVGLSIFCITILYSFLFVSLWRYRELVGLSLLGILVLLALVYMRGKLNEQRLRQVRYHQHEETPLDEYGEPVYWQHGYQANPHRTRHSSYQSAPHDAWSEGYQQQEH